MDSTDSESKPLSVALIGNPNTGKSTLFSALAGMAARTGNYPGVTIEKKVAQIHWNHQPVELIDLPGTYSLAPRSPDELVAINVLTGGAETSAPDVIVCVVNATLLQRNFFLLSQLLELKKPIVVAVNMIDVADARDIKIDIDRIAEKLGIPVVAVSASKRQGIEQLKETLIQPVRPGQQDGPLLPPVFYGICERLQHQLSEESGYVQETSLSDYIIQRAVLDQNGEAERVLCKNCGEGALAAIEQARNELRDQTGIEPSDMECNARYAWAAAQLEDKVHLTDTLGRSATDRLDAVLTHRVLGFALFCLVMLVTFQTIYGFAGIPMEYIDSVQSTVSGWITEWMNPGTFRSLIIDGVIAGVGGVLIFLPQIALLFLFLAILEDCGYMARAAFLVDRIMGLLGLSGKSFLPLMSSFACAVPGVMSTRVIGNPRERVATIMVAPLMSCSARLPVYALLIAAFIPAQSFLGGWLGLHGLVLMAMYLLGVLVAIPVAWILRKTLLQGESAPFVLELPEYKFPAWRVVLSRVYESCKAFVIRAGTLIFATSIVIWAAGYFPGDHRKQFALQKELEQLKGSIEAPPLPQIDDASQVQKPQTRDTPSNFPQVAFPSNAAAKTKELSHALAKENARLLENSFLGRLGHLIEPIVQPLGWDWKIGVGAIASFPAREVIISTLGTIYSLGDDGDDSEDSGGQLIQAIQSAKRPDGTNVYNVPVALSIMVFFALCAQCVSTLLVILRETNSWKWPLLSFTYMTALAYVGALIVYQIGIRIG